MNEPCGTPVERLVTGTGASRPGSSRSPSGIRTLVLPLLAALVVALPVGPAAAIDQIATALRQKTWIRATSKGPRGRGVVEHWLNPGRQVAALKAPPVITLHDAMQKTFAKYVPADKTLYLLPEPPAGTPDSHHTCIQLLEEFENPKRFPFPGSEVINRTRREVDVDGRKWIDLELTVQVAGGSRGGPHTLTYRIDSQSKLPRLMTWNDEMGDKDETQIDYPEIGPADIYDLGVPRTVTIVDRIPSDEVRRVVSERSSGRRQFDDYIAYVLEERILPENTFPRVQAYRVSRKGRKWRIDRLRPLKEDWIPPRDANVRWWRDQQKSFVAVPKIVSNGPAYWDYYIGDNWKPGDAVAAAGGEIVGPNGLEGPGNDPDLPFWCQDLMPEQAGHPTAGIGDPDDDRVFSIEAKPLDGPRATIMLYGRNPLVPNAGPDHFRVWLDPAAGYLSKRVEVRVVDDKDHSKVAYIDTHIIEAFEKSPKGRWYPTKVRQLATGGDYEFVRTFYVDFEVVAPDESFEPLR